jgi:5-keto 4-deoxyuronate isomerase
LGNTSFMWATAGGNVERTDVRSVKISGLA